MPADLITKGPHTARFRGIFAENHVSQQLCAGEVPHYYWNVENRAEVEFVIRADQGVIPIDVKSGENAGSVTLGNTRDKYGCPFAIRISGKNFWYENRVFSVPLRAACMIKELVVGEDRTTVS